MWPHLAVQAHLHRADLPREWVDAEELGPPLFQDGTAALHCLSPDRPHPGPVALVT